MKKQSMNHTFAARLSGVLLIITLCFIGFITPVYAQNIHINHGGLVRAADKSAISASQAGNRAKRKYGGKVLKITSAGANYRVRLLLDSGKVINVTVNGKTGKVG